MEASVKISPDKSPEKSNETASEILKKRREEYQKKVI